MANPQTGPVQPDGIVEDHARPAATWRRHASPLSVIVLGAVVALGLSGVLGHERTWSVTGADAVLSVDAPETIRNGELLEMRIRVDGERPIDELIIGIDRSLWEDMTVNTMIPAATEERSEDGEFRFAFGRLAADTAFLLKTDLQVNPDLLGSNAGTITVYDGADPLAEARIEIRVLP